MSINTLPDLAENDQLYLCSSLSLVAINTHPGTNNRLSDTFSLSCQDTARNTAKLTISTSHESMLPFLLVFARYQFGFCTETDWVLGIWPMFGRLGSQIRYQCGLQSSKIFRHNAQIFSDTSHSRHTMVA